MDIADIEHTASKNVLKNCKLSIYIINVHTYVHTYIIKKLVHVNSKNSTSDMASLSSGIVSACGEEIGS
jgi:orotidine-5'-phosphate decarboxylase